MDGTNGKYNKCIEFDNKYKTPDTLDPINILMLYIPKQSTSIDKRVQNVFQTMYAILYYNLLTVGRGEK